MILRICLEVIHSIQICWGIKMKIIGMSMACPLFDKLYVTFFFGSKSHEQIVKNKRCIPKQMVNRSDERFLHRQLH